MKRAILIAALLTGCATPPTPEQRAEAIINAYSPACEKLGLAKGTNEWASCLMRHYEFALREQEAATAAGMAVLGMQPMRQRSVCQAQGPTLVCF